MDVIPVLDLMDGQVVRGVAGQRETYAPLESTLTTSALPLDVARGLRQAFGLHRLYVADLDAIMHDTPQWPIIDTLIADGFELLVDGGLRDASRAEQLVERGVAQVIAALETIATPELLAEIVSRIGAGRAVFSLDLMQGRALGDLTGWKTADPEIIAGMAVAAGVATLIVLDLSGVGVGKGVPTLAMCRRLREHHPHLRLITGGGVRNMSDIRHALESGVDGLLVASALHNGSIIPQAIALLGT